MTNHFNKLTEAEQERLALLAEELGEATQRVGKVLRHGYFSTHPDGGLNNQEQLELEIGDVLSAIDRLTRYNDLDFKEILKRRNYKTIQAEKYLHHQG